MRTNKHFSYKIKRTIYKVQISDIVCLESYKRKMILHLADGQKAEFYRNLKDICQANVMDCGFIHIHKSYVVNFNYIRSLKYLELTLVDGTTLPISQKRYKEVKQRYLNLAGMC